MTVADLLADSPALVVALAVLLRAGLAWQSNLSWTEYRALHTAKRLGFPILDRVAPVLSWVNPKGGRDDGEFLRTVPVSVRETVRLCRRAGGSLHLIASLKRRPGDHGDRLTRAHVVWIHDDGTQTEAYLFANDDGSTDVYVHHEPAPSRPLAHLGGDAQSDGDERGVVADALTADLPVWDPSAPD